MSRLTILDHPTLPTYVEMRFWVPVGHPGQVVRLGELNLFDASQVIWWEIIQVVAGRRVFYFRHFLDTRTFAGFKSEVACFRQAVCDELGVTGTCPESGFIVRRVKAEPGLGDESPLLPAHYELETWLSDLGFAQAGLLKAGGLFSEGQIQFTHTTYHAGNVHSFLQETAAELESALAGRLPDLGRLEPSNSRWDLVEQLNARAYDFLSADFAEKYFRRPRVVKAFDSWLSQVPVGAQILDIGCGHGAPVIGRLLRARRQVTGIDPSPAMLAKARQRYPQARIIQGTLQDLPGEATFAAACSFCALLYLDPIDLCFALLRLHSALAPGGLLFLYSYFDHPDWIGGPIDHGLGPPMWAWDYNVAAAETMLNAHNLFEVVQRFNFFAPGKRTGPYALVARRLP